MMRKLALVLMMLILSSAAQARDYKEDTTLLCVWPDGRIESFILGGSYRSPIGLSNVWTVASIHQYPDTVRVRLERHDRERVITFNNGWPCRLEVDYTRTDHELLQPESDSFDPVD